MLPELYLLDHFSGSWSFPMCSCSDQYCSVYALIMLHNLALLIILHWMCSMIILPVRLQSSVVFWHPIFSSVLNLFVHWAFFNFYCIENLWIRMQITPTVIYGCISIVPKIFRWNSIYIVNKWCCNILNVSKK